MIFTRPFWLKSSHSSPKRYQILNHSAVWLTANSMSWVHIEKVAVQASSVLEVGTICKWFQWEFELSRSPKEDQGCVFYCTEFGHRLMFHKSRCYGWNHLPGFFSGNRGLRTNLEVSPIFILFKATGVRMAWSWKWGWYRSSTSRSESEPMTGRYGPGEGVERETWYFFTMCRVGYMQNCAIDGARFELNLSPLIRIMIWCRRMILDFLFCFVWSSHNKKQSLSLFR